MNLFDQNCSADGAIFSTDRRYRYLLWRSWEGFDRLVLFVGLNPSTADEKLDDPTIRRCKAFAKSWSASGFVIANLFAYKATSPKVLLAESEPIGSENDKYLAYVSQIALRTVACWGNHGAHRDRASEVLPLLRKPEYLRLNQSGHPAHPLYLPSTLVPQKFD